MGKRLDLHNLLVVVLGTKNVYYEPPPAMLMIYPCIVYERDAINTKFSDDLPYRTEWRYSLTVIDRNPDSEIPEKIARLPKTTHTRSFVSDGQHHYVFSIYY